MSQSSEAETDVRNILENTVSIPSTFHQATVSTVIIVKAIVDLSQKQLAGMRLTCEGTLRYKDDGGVPTASEGERLLPGSYWFSRQEAKNLQIVAAGPNVVCQFQPQTFAN